MNRRRPLQVVGLIALALIFAAGASAETLGGQRWKDVVTSRSVTDETALRVDIQYGGGTLNLKRSEAGVLYRANFRFDEGSAEPITEYSEGRLSVGLRSVGSGGRDGYRAKNENSLAVELTDEIPLDLRLGFGAGRAEIDVTGIRIARIDISAGAAATALYIREKNPETAESATFSAGAAEFTVRGLGNLNAREVSVEAGVGAISLDLSGEWPPNARLDAEFGVGSLELRIPEGLGVQLRQRGFLASLDTDGLVKRNGVYRSRNWESAARKLDIELSATLGTVDLIWIR